MPHDHDSFASSSRRKFLAQLALAGVALPLASRVARAADADASPVANEKGRTCVHVFSKAMHGFSYADAAALAAEAGFGGIDFTVRPAGHVLPERVEEDLPRAVEAARQVGLRVEMITTVITDPRDQVTEKILRTAGRLGVKYYRMGYFDYDEARGVWPSLQARKPAMRELADLNRQCGLHGAYQNHAGVRVGASSWDLYELLRELDPQWIGCQYDVRHAVAEGGQSWALGLQLLAPWIKCTDIKDFKWSQSGGKWAAESVPLGEGMVDFDRYFKLVRKLKLSGPISVHLEYPPFERAKPSLSTEEKRRVFPSALRKDRATLSAWLERHQLA